MHIALVIPDLGGGGAERSMLTLATGLIRRGHEVDLVLFRTRIHYADELPEDARLFALSSHRPDRRTAEHAGDALARLTPVSVTLNPLDWFRLAGALDWDPRCLPGGLLARQAKAVAAYVAREAPDCVLPSLPRPKIATLLGCTLLDDPPPVVPTVRNVIQYSQRQRRQAGHLFRNAAHFICVSRGVSDSLATSVSVPRERITTIYNPVVTGHLRAGMRQHPDHPWLLDGGAPVILAAGRLTAQKDYPTLLRAFARLAARRPCRLIVLGEGECRPELQRLVDDLKLTDSVSMPGWVENPFAFMSRASLFVLSSVHEGLPGVLIQALACGCPCVSTDCPAGPAEVLQEGDLGPLVPVGDEIALADAMARVLDEPPDRQRLKEHGARFSEERAAAAYEDLIGSVVRPGQPHGGPDMARVPPDPSKQPACASS